MDLITVSIDFVDCLASIELSNKGDDIVTLTIRELEVDQCKSHKNHTEYKTIRQTVVHLGVDEVQAINDALSFIKPKE